MVTIKKLNCGTTVIMEKSERVQSAALGIWVRAGASDEWDEVSGVSHFIEHMMFKGTKNRTAKQIAEDVDKIGGVFNAFTGKEATCYYIKTLSSNICKGSRNFARHADWFEVRSGGNGRKDRSSARRSRW